MTKGIGSDTDPDFNNVHNTSLCTSLQGSKEKWKECKDRGDDDKSASAYSCSWSQLDQLSVWNICGDVNVVLANVHHVNTNKG